MVEGERISTGIEGLDIILEGGLIPNKSYLIRGNPGTGKTILGLHFLEEGTKTSEKCLFINLGEPATQIRANAENVGLDISKVEFLDLSPKSDFFSKIETYDIFSPAEVEREPTTKQIIELVKKIKPHRVFVDPITQFRYLARDDFQFHKQTLSFLRFLLEQNATVLFTSEFSHKNPDDDLQFMCDGIINLGFDLNGRSIQVSKFRGSNFKTGINSMTLTKKGMNIFPKLVPHEYGVEFSAELISSGIPEMDELLHGGIERGTINLISGPSGVGKTTVGIQFMNEAAGRGERSVIYTFEESRDKLIHRSESVNIL